MKLNSNVYDVLKWLCLTVSPAFIVMLTSFGDTLGIDIVVATQIISAVTLFVSTILGFSTANYYKEQNEIENFKGE